MAARTSRITTPVEHDPDKPAPRVKPVKRYYYAAAEAKTLKGNRGRLTRMITERSRELHIPLTVIAARANISESLFRKIRNDNKSLSILVAADLEKALKWAPGSIKRILGNGNPQPLEDEVRDEKKILAEWKAKLTKADYARLSKDLKLIVALATDAAREEFRSEYARLLRPTKLATADTDA